MRGTSLPRIFFSSAISFLGLAGILVPVASAATVQNRINSTISDENRTEVAHSVNPRVARAADRGPVAADMRLTRAPGTAFGWPAPVNPLIPTRSPGAMSVAASCAVITLDSEPR